MSAPAPASHPSGVPQLRVVGDTGAEPGWNLDRPLALLACAGAPLQLTAEEADLVALTNAAGHYARRILDPDVEPDDVHPAEYIVEYMMAAHGLNRRAKGDRVAAVESNHRRYLIPFFTELAFTRPEGKKGIAYLRLPQLETVPRMLAGDAPLPAATVAADQFRDRVGLQCLHLNVDDARHVVTDNALLDAAALDTGRLPTYPDIRTGEALVRPHDLRAAGLLAERRPRTASQPPPPRTCCET